MKVLFGREPRDREVKDREEREREEGGIVFFI